MRARRRAVLLVVAAVALGALWLLRPASVARTVSQARDLGPGRATPVEPFRGLGWTLASAATRVASGAAGSSQQTGSPRSTAAASGPVAGSSAPDPHAARVPPPSNGTDRAARRVELEQILHEEPVDVRESVELRRDLEAAAEDLGLAAEILEVSCRDTLCRIEVHLRVVEDVRALAELAVDPDQHREVFVEPTDNGGLDVVSYRFRGQAGSIEVP